MIVVTAPTSQIGSKVVAGLLAADADVRVVVCDAARLPDYVRQRVQIVEGSHVDPAIVDRAFAHVDAVFWLVPPDTSKSLDEAWLDFIQPAAEALRWNAVQASCPSPRSGMARVGRIGPAPSPPPSAPTSC